MDFIAVNADGQPVTDLTASQLALKVGGKDRAVTSLELVRFSDAASMLPTPFATNAMSDAGRNFVLVVDEESLRPGIDNTVREALAGAAAPARHADQPPARGRSHSDRGRVDATRTARAAGADT